MLNIVFAGNVGGDVTLREVTVRDEPVKVASFSVAVDNGKNVDGEDLPPTWIRVSVWRSYAEVVHLCLVRVPQRRQQRGIERLIRCQHAQRPEAPPVGVNQPPRLTFCMLDGIRSTRMRVGSTRATSNPVTGSYPWTGITTTQVFLHGRAPSFDAAGRCCSGS